MIDIRVNVEGKIVPAPGMIFVCNLEKGKKLTKGGLEVPHDENMGVYDQNTNTHRGIRPRWAQVYAIAKDVKDIQPKQWVLLSHGHWSTIMKLNINGEDRDLQVIIEKNIKNGVLSVVDEMPTELEGYAEIKPL